MIERVQARICFVSNSFNVTLNQKLKNEGHVRLHRLGCTALNPSGESCLSRSSAQSFVCAFTRRSELKLQSSTTGADMKKWVLNEIL